MVIGITGGVGCGKTTVINILRERYGAKVIVADELGHEAMKPGTGVYDRIRKTFGREFVMPDGTIDRQKLSKRIYGDETEREKLNAIVHPYVLDQIRGLLEKWSGEPLICLETALLFETGCDRLCDTVFCVMTDRELRIRRMMKLRGYTREKAESIMRAQLSDAQWRERCDFCIENNGNFDKIEERLQDLLGTVFFL